MTIKRENAQWDELCALTTKLLPQYGGRPAAFQGACQQRPDLASVAVDPVGNPVIPAKAAGVSAGEVRGDVEADAGALGAAKPWSDVMRSLAVEAGEQQPAEKPAGNRGGAIPWGQVFAGIERAEHGGAR